MTEILTMVLKIPLPRLLILPNSPFISVVNQITTETYRKAEIPRLSEKFIYFFALPRRVLYTGDAETSKTKLISQN